MVDLTTTYAGLKLKSPIIAASSSLTASPAKIKTFAEAGAGAVILKSIFEEQIQNEAADTYDQSHDFPEAYNYIKEYSEEHSIRQHVQLVREVKAEVDIPVFASINCSSSEGWVDYAKSLSDAGADGLELNVMRIETDRTQDYGEPERAIIKIVTELRESGFDKPLVVKISKYYSNLIRLCADLHMVGADGVVLFNRSYMPDVDLSAERLTAGPVLSSPSDFYDGLRFTALVQGAVPGLSVSISSGARNGKDVLKGVLAGANAIQMASILYGKKEKAITESLDEVKSWMEEHKYESITEMTGRLAAEQVDKANFLARSQFMKYFDSPEAGHPTNTFSGAVERPRG